MDEDGPVARYPEECWHCGNCKIDCPSNAVTIQFPLSMLI
jgi:NAD-dependent dihydropyrimidine dehydrogenase PreA subunit